MCIACVNSYIWNTMCKGICTHMHAYSYINMHTHANAHSHIHTHTCTHIGLYIHAWYTHTHTHWHISSLKRVTCTSFALVIIYWAQGLGQELETLVVPTSSPPGSHCECRNLNQSVRPRAFSWLVSASLPSLSLWERHPQVCWHWESGVCGHVQGEQAFWEHKWPLNV